MIRVGPDWGLLSPSRALPMLCSSTYLDVHNYSVSVFECNQCVVIFVNRV